MYSVSQAYLDKLYSGSIQRRIKGFVGTVAFTENDILASSFSYTEKCINSADINLGGVFIGQFECTFLPSFASRITRGSWRGRAITFSIGLNVGNTWVDIPCKPYVIDEATWSKTGVTVKAYDAMYEFDRNFNLSTTTGTLYDFAMLACQACGVQFGMTEVECQALPNGTEILGVYTTNDIETWRDFISWCAVTCCCFATINREGKLVFRSWHTTPDLVIDVNDRFTGGSWSDFTTYYTGISIVNIEDESTTYYSVEPDTGLTMNLGSNPLMQYGTNEVKTRQRLAVLTALQNFVYTPYNSTSLIDPILDLGDVIEYVNGLAGDNSICCVHKMEFKYAKGMKLTGYGKNPAVFGARSKTDKNLSGLLSKQDENVLVTYTYENAEELFIDDTPTSIIKIRFATINAKIVKLLHEIQMETEADPTGDGIVSAQAYCYLNNELLSFSPVSTWNNDGIHLMPIMYWLQNLEGGRQYTWEVKLAVNGGTATIDREWIHAILEAQGLVAADEWGGQIDVEDELTLIGHGKATFGTLTESVGFVWYDVEDIEYADVISLIGHGKATFGTMSDEIDIDVIKNVYNIVSEDKDYRLVSEDKQYNFESEGRQHEEE